MDTPAVLRLLLLLVCAALQASPGQAGETAPAAGTDRPAGTLRPGAPCPQDAIGIAPGQSLREAVEAAGEGASFCIAAGLHRLQAIQPKRGQSFHGAPGAILSGAMLLTDFGRDGDLHVAEGLNLQRRENGYCLEERPACNLPEALFIDDAPLEQVIDLAEVGPGRFHIDYASGRLYFADDPQGRRVELARAMFAFFGSAPDVTITGLVVEKYANPAQQGAIQGEHGHGWSVEDCEIRFNSAVGISLGSGSRVVGSYIHSNGQLGVTADGRDILVENNEIARNNIYGFDTHWEAGGLKITVSRDIVIRGNHAHHNEGSGLWTDIDVYDVLYEHNLVEHNRYAGIFHEISFEAVIRNNRLRYNNRGAAPWFWGAEIQIAASQGVEVYANDITVGPDGHSIMLIDQNRGPAPDGSLYKTANNRVYENRVTYEGDGGGGGISDADPGMENYSIIEEGGNLFDSNLYRMPHAGEEVRFPWGHEEYDLEGFRALGQERNGRVVFY